jgi:hypothetical protein
MAVKGDVDLVWAALRSTRATPPSGIKGDRHKTYAAALEQAQQMFTAAASVGVATRPLLLFYGLSQGGRAIAAAAKHVHNNDYPLIGHGIKANKSTLVGPLANVQVHTDNTAKGSFTRLSTTILGSPVWDDTNPVTSASCGTPCPRPASFRSATRPASARFPCTSTSSASCLRPRRPAGADHRNWHSVRRYRGRRAGFGGVPWTVPEARRILGDRSEGGVPRWSGGTVDLTYSSSHTGYQERTAEALTHTTRYRLHDRFVFPAVGANTDSLHPVMAWWAVLFALSMLARYGRN